MHILSRPGPQRGVSRSSRTLGRGCGGRGGVRRAIASRTNDAEAYGQVVSFWRPNAGVKSAIRSAGDGVNKPGHRGEREVSRKTIARGMPGETGVTVVTMLVCFIYFAREAAGALSARHSLRPLLLGAAKQFLQTSGASRREIAESHLTIAVIARSKATKQSTLTSRQHGLLRVDRNDDLKTTCVPLFDS